MGARFFESIANTTLLKRMKKRLQEVADHHHNEASHMTALANQGSSSNQETNEGNND